MDDAEKIRVLRMAVIGLMNAGGPKLDVRLCDNTDEQNEQWRANNKKKALWDREKEKALDALSATAAQLISETTNDQ